MDGRRRLEEERGKLSLISMKGARQQRSAPTSQYSKSGGEDDQITTPIDQTVATDDAFIYQVAGWRTRIKLADS